MHVGLVGRDRAVAAPAFVHQERAQAILDDAPPPIPIDDAVLNMCVIAALFRSAESGRWETP